MNDKEYTYDIDKYTIGVDENGEDGIGMTVAKIENGGLHFLGNCYGENARCIDLLIKENQSLKKENQFLKKQLEEYQKELEKADSITQSCIFNGKEESKISYRKCLNMLDKKETQQKEFIKYLETWKENEEYCYLASSPIDRCRKDIYEEILQKYKEMIGDDK